MDRSSRSEIIEALELNPKQSGKEGYRFGECLLFDLPEASQIGGEERTKTGFKRRNSIQYPIGEGDRFTHLSIRMNKRNIK